jgi:hypothetical protein
MSKRLTTRKIVKRSRQVHGDDKYDYSEVEYISVHTKIKIFCKKHEKYFWQRPHVHMYGSGCPDCGMESSVEKRRSSRDEFEEKSRIVHGDKYDYSEVEYVNVDTKVKIYCKKHEKHFEQTPYDHTSGRGCPDCGRRSSRDEFEEKSKIVHGDKYDYSEVEYVNNHTKVKIYCKKHEKYFEQIPSIHANGGGCPDCGIESRVEKRKSSRDEFEEKSKIVHGDKYDYSEVEYVNNHTKVKIYCKKHGKYFEQAPSHHLNGRGCHDCGRNSVSKSGTEWLNSLEIGDLEMEFPITISSGKRYIVDGFSKNNKTIYEYFGDFWHGNPEKYDQCEVNVVNKKTFGELYQKTIQKVMNLEAEGYRVVFKWEDYRK